MKLHQVLLLSDSSSSLLPSLEKLFDSEPQIKIKFISPQKIYKTDFEESEFIILDYGYYLKNQTELKSVFNYLDKLSIFATLTNHQEMIEIIKATKVSHLFGMSGTHTLNDIKSYIVASIENKFWNSETLITAPVINKSLTSFSTSDHLDQQIETAIQTHDFSKTFEGFKLILIQILNEALTNALYNAPVDEKGNFLYRNQNRRKIITTDVKNAPTLEIVEDEEKIILSVKDYYGSLTKEIIDHYLTEGKVSDKDGGAGLGMYLILNHAHKLIINLDPGKLTEFIIVLHKFKRFFHYETLEKSYHLYQRKLS